MGAGSSVGDALSDAAADVEVSLTEALDTLRGYSAPRRRADPPPMRTCLTRCTRRCSTRAAREKGWKAIGIVSLRDAKLRVRAAALSLARRASCPKPPLRLLQDLPSSVFELREAVKTLDVTNNRLATLPPALAALTNLQRLVRPLGAFVAPRRTACTLMLAALQVLTQNALTALPPAICGLTGLKLLMLDGNALRSLPDELGALVRLEKLSVAGNALTALPDALGSLKSLKTLCVARNQLQALPAALSTCAALEELDAAGNALQALPPQLGALPRLALLQLDDNALRGVPSELLRGCVALTTLSLHGNPVTLDALEATDGWAEFDTRQRAKQSKRVAGGVLIGARGLDDGLDHSTTKIVVPHT